jgi:hypothetical protein
VAVGPCRPPGPGDGGVGVVDGRGGDEPPNARRRVLAAERGLSGIPLTVSGASPANVPPSPNPPPPPARVRRTPRPSQSPRRRDRPRETLAPTRCDGPATRPDGTQHHGTDKRSGYPPNCPFFPGVQVEEGTTPGDIPATVGFSRGVRRENPQAEGISGRPVQPTFPAVLSGATFPAVLSGATCPADLPGHPVRRDLSSRPSRPSCPAHPGRRILSGDACQAFRQPPIAAIVHFVHQIRTATTSAHASGAQSRRRCDPNRAPTETTQGPVLARSGLARVGRDPGTSTDPRRRGGAQLDGVASISFRPANRPGVLRLAGRFNQNRRRQRITHSLDTIPGCAGRWLGRQDLSGPGGW